MQPANRKNPYAILAFFLLMDIYFLALIPFINKPLSDAFKEENSIAVLIIMGFGASYLVMALIICIFEMFMEKCGGEIVNHTIFRLFLMMIFLVSRFFIIAFSTAIAAMP